MLFSRNENIFMCLVAFQKMFRKIFFGVWLCSWKYHRKHIFCLLLTFSHIFSVAKKIYNIIHSLIQRHKQNLEKKISSNPVKLREEGRERERGNWVRQEVRSRDVVLRSRLARRQDRDRHGAATIRPGQKGEGDRERERSAARSHRCICESFFLSLFLPLRVCELLSLRVSVPEVIWR